MASQSVMYDDLRLSDITKPRVVRFVHQLVAGGYDKVRRRDVRYASHPSRERRTRSTRITTTWTLCTFSICSPPFSIGCSATAEVYLKPAICQARLAQNDTAHLSRCAVSLLVRLFHPEVTPDRVIRMIIHRHHLLLLEIVILSPKMTKLSNRSFFKSVIVGGALRDQCRPA